MELVRGSNVVRNLHLEAPLSAALANGDDTLSITADCYSIAAADAAVAAALLAYYTSAQVDALLVDYRTGTDKGVEADLQLLHHDKSLLLTEPGDMVSTAQMSNLVRDTTANFRQQEVPAAEDAAAQAGYQWAVKEKKAAELLSASIKMEKSADVPLQTKSYCAKWALQEAKGRDQAQEKAKMLWKSAEDFKELATLHPAGGKEREQGKNEQQLLQLLQLGSSPKRWPQLRSSPKWWPLRLSRMQLKLSRAPLKAGKDPTGAAGRKSPPEKGEKNKGRKRKAWLEAQISSLKVNGRWVGPGHPSAVAKAIRLAKDCLERSH